MWKAATGAAFAILAIGNSAAAQDKAASQIGPCQKIGVSASGSSAAHEALYASATCIAARAGVSATSDARLSQQELISILLLMSTQGAPMNPDS